GIDSDPHAADVMDIVVQDAGMRRGIPDVDAGRIPRGYGIKADIAILDRVVGGSAPARDAVVDEVLYLEPVDGDVGGIADADDAARHAVAAIEHSRIHAGLRIVLPRLAVVGGGQGERAAHVVGAALDIGGLDRAVLHRLLGARQGRERRRLGTGVAVVAGRRHVEAGTRRHGAGASADCGGAAAGRAGTAGAGRRIGRDIEGERAIAEQLGGVAAA